ncbi:hypothetical protein PCANC_21341 [Puccinia coronata f. sp. avenae]|uniref:Uncharacterized protein n=1 Tax=Puccinia coronata f. sp. avenae TaxID=200324 RepID=A0A2N5SD47_9BASI|nr:hypothetical protein PCANC_21341 [Puccinia coronata f. sp. avenae]
MCSQPRRARRWEATQHEHLDSLQSPNKSVSMVWETLRGTRWEASQDEQHPHWRNEYVSEQTANTERRSSALLGGGLSQPFQTIKHVDVQPVNTSTSIGSHPTRAP